MPEENAEDLSPWWRNGLRFECFGCGRCCRGAAGGIFMLPGEERTIASHLGISVEELKIRYETSRWRFPSLKEKGGGRCVMNGDDGRCRVYPCRPHECSTWPFWPELLESSASWAKAARHCPGMDSGPLWTFEQISAVLEGHESYVRRLALEWGEVQFKWRTCGNC